MFYNIYIYNNNTRLKSIKIPFFLLTDTYYPWNKFFYAFMVIYTNVIAEK